MKSIKNLIVPFIVMVVLVAVAVAVVISNSKNSGSSDEASDTRLDVISIPATQISSVEVSRADGTGIGFQSAVDDTGVFIWSLMSKFESPAAINNSDVSAWVAVLSSFMADARIGDKSQLNLADYGLADPLFTVTIVQFDGTTDKIYVGNKTVDGSRCYFTVEGDEGIYTVVNAKYLYCSYDLIDFLESESLGVEYANLATVEFKRLSDDLDMVASCELYETGDPLFTAISPFKIECSPYFTSLIEDIVGLDITSYVDIPDDELADYGLDNPSYTFIFTMKDGRVTEISLSYAIDNYYYGKCSGIDGYFRISTMQISGLNTQIMMLLEGYLVYYSATDISKITGTYGDDSFTYEIDTTGSISADDATAMLNSRNAKIFNSNGRSYAAILFESLVTITMSGIDIEADPAFEPEIEFTYYTKNHDVITLSFVPKDSNNYYVFLDGEYSSFTCARREMFNDGGENTFDYGAWAAFELCRTAIDNQIAGVYDIPASEAAG